MVFSFNIYSSYYKVIRDKDNNMKKLFTILFTLFTIAFSTSQNQRILTTDVYGNIYTPSRTYNSNEVKLSTEKKFNELSLIRDAVVQFYEIQKSNPSIANTDRYVVELAKLESIELSIIKEYYFWITMGLQAKYGWALDKPLRILRGRSIYYQEYDNDLLSYNELKRMGLLTQAQKNLIEKL